MFFKLFLKVTKIFLKSNLNNHFNFVYFKKKISFILKNEVKAKFFFLICIHLFSMINLQIIVKEKNACLLK